MNASRYFALIPAAGSSQRMGQPKLLLALEGRPLMAWTIAAWRRSRVDHVLVVVRPDDGELAEAAGRAGAEVVIPVTPPADMKASLQAALRHIQTSHAPTGADAFLVAPADMPRLSAAIIDRLIETHHADQSRIVVPLVGDKRGHPVLFPWSLAAEVFQLRDGEGLNAIVERNSPLLIACDDLIALGEEPFADVDTPADWQRLQGERVT